MSERAFIGSPWRLRSCSQPLTPPSAAAPTNLPRRRTLEIALRAGVVRAIEDAERVDAIDAAAVVVLRAAALALPFEYVLDKLHRVMPDLARRDEWRLRR